MKSKVIALLLSCCMVTTLTPAASFADENITSGNTIPIEDSIKASIEDQQSGKPDVELGGDVGDVEAPIQEENSTDMTSNDKLLSNEDTETNEEAVKPMSQHESGKSIYISTEDELISAIENAKGTKNNPTKITLLDDIELERSLEISNKGAYIRIMGENGSECIKPIDGCSITYSSLIKVLAGHVTFTHVVIDAMGKSRVIYVDDSGSTFLTLEDNAIIKNGSVSGNATGGGIMCHGATVIFDGNCLFNNNTAGNNPNDVSICDGNHKSNMIIKSALQGNVVFNGNINDYIAGEAYTITNSDLSFAKAVSGKAFGLDAVNNKLILAQAVTANFDANGGTGSMASQSIPSGFETKLEKNTFIASDGKAFAGWNTEADGTGTAYANADMITLTEAATLYAQWENAPTISGYCGDPNVNEGRDVRWLFNQETGTLSFEGKGPISRNDSSYPWGKLKDEVISVKIGDSITEIPDGAFSKYSAMQTLSIGKSVERIGESAFYMNHGLKNVKLPMKLKQISKCSFAYCNNLTAFTVDPKNTTFKAENGIVYSINGDTLVLYPTGKKEKNVVVKNGVKNIAISAFRGAQNIISVTLPDSVENIYGFAFVECSNMQKIYFGKGLKYIAEYTFEKTPVEEIHTNDLKSWFNLVLGSDSGTNAKRAHPFGYTSSLAFNAGKETAFYVGEDKVGTLEVPEGVTAINKGLFNKVRSLKTAILKNDVKNVGQESFLHNENLETIFLGEKVENVEWEAFGCTNKLKNVVIESDSIEIAQKAFYADNEKNICVYIPTASTKDGINSYHNKSKLVFAVTNGGSIPTNTNFEAGKLATPKKQGSSFIGWYESDDFSGEAVTSLEYGKTYYAKWQENTEASKPWIYDIEDLWVNGMQLIDGHYQTSNTIDGVTFENDTLKLENADILNFYEYMPESAPGTTAGIYCKGNLTITLEGNNTIGTEAKHPTHGIMANGNLIIKGDGSITTYGTNNGIAANPTNSTLTIESGQINAIGSKCCVRGNGNIVINGGIVNVSNSGSKGGLFAENGTITVNGGQIKATENATYGLKAKELIVNKGTVSSLGNNADIHVSAAYHINGGSLIDGTAIKSDAFAVPVKSGYKFVGWYEESDFSGEAATAPTANKAYYAKWESVYSVDSIEDKKYSGTEQKPEVIVRNGGEVIPEDQYIVSYEDTDYSNVGIKNIEVTIKEDGQEFNKSFEIVKDTPTLTLSNINETAGKTYDVNPIAKLSNGSLINDADITIKYYTNKGCTEGESETKPAKVGAYYAKATLTGNSNYNTVNSGVVEIVLNAADCPSVVATGYDGIYDNETHKPTIVSDDETVEIAYSSNNGKTYKKTVPTYINSGEYTVYYKVHKDGCTDFVGTLSINIEKVNPYPFKLVADKKKLIGGGSVRLKVYNASELPYKDIVCDDSSIVIPEVGANGYYNITLPKIDKTYTFTVELDKLANRNVASGVTTCSVQVCTKQPAKICTDQIFLARGDAGKKSISYQWNKVKGANSYEIYFAKCGEKFRCIKKTAKTKFVKSHLKPGRSYKLYIVAYNNGKKIASTPRIHVMTLGGQYSNAVGITATKKLSMNKGSTASIKIASIKRDVNKNLHTGHITELRYYTNSAKIAKVSSTGKVKAISSGTCYIYTVTHSGYTSKTKVVVH